MDAISLGSLNYLAILVGVVINQALGAAWYSALAKPWMAEVGLTQEDLDAHKGTPRAWYPFVIAAGSAFVFIVALAMLVQGLGADSAGEGLLLGLLVSVGFVIAAQGTGYAFEGRSLKLFAMNSAYPLISFSIIGILLAVWQ